MTSRGSRLEKVATMPSGPVSRPWRRFLRFSVRGLMTVVLVIGTGMGLGAHFVQSTASNTTQCPPSENRAVMSSTTGR